MFRRRGIPTVVFPGREVRLNSLLAEPVRLKTGIYCLEQRLIAAHRRAQKSLAEVSSASSNVGTSDRMARQLLRDPHPARSGNRRESAFIPGSPMPRGNRMPDSRKASKSWASGICLLDRMSLTTSRDNTKFRAGEKFKQRKCVTAVTPGMRIILLRNQFVLGFERVKRSALSRSCGLMEA